MTISRTVLNGKTRPKFTKDKKHRLGLYDKSDDAANWPVAGHVSLNIGGLTGVRLTFILFMDKGQDAVDRSGIL